MTGFEIIIKEERLLLLPERAVFWKKHSSLLLADLHLGKTSHFRKEGIGIPEAIGEEDYKKLHALLTQYPSKNVYFLGDLFHSTHNKEWSRVSETIEAFPKTTFHLVLGNHDILNKEDYLASGLIVHNEYLDVGPFKFIHEPPESFRHSDKFIFCGHIHPGVGIKGKGRQYIRLPCFFQKSYFMILPAFGTFTGVKTLKITGGCNAFAILNNKVIPIKE